MAHRPHLVCLLFGMASNLRVIFMLLELLKKTKKSVIMTHENSDCPHP